MRKILQITAAVFFVLMFVIMFTDTSISVSLDAMSWPSENAVLIRNFGSNNNGSPVLGMVFGGGTEILAAEKGEIIFSAGRNDSASRLPSPLGAWTAIDHGDGLISIYSRYDDVSSDKKFSDQEFSLTHIEKSQPIAGSGTSGWSAQNGFYFIIFDRRERHWINPAMIITPVQKTRPPQIMSVELKNDQGVTQSRNLSQGRYTVFVNTVSPAVNPAAGGNFLVPHRIICLINGSEIGSLNFEAFSAKDGVLMVYRNGLVPARQIYSNAPAYEAAEFFLNRGQVNMEIIVQDLAGESRNFINWLFIN
ncbi:MAG: M23 family metallopeptidase [Spirochaetes bacterium]|nr:M23 family metallopeptidase [Spirochaetota bacterium]